MLQAINLGTTANDGTGDTPRVAGTKINANALDLQARQGSILRGSPLVVFDGDSKTIEAYQSMSWAVSRMGLDADIWPQIVYGVGGSKSDSAGTSGLTSPARLASTLAGIQGYVAAGRVVDVSLRMFTNDPGAFTPEQSLTNLKLYHNQVVRAGGARYLLLWGCEPVAGDTNANTYAYSMNRLMQQYAALNSFDTIFIDCSNALTDPAAANAAGSPIPYTYTSGAAPVGSVTRDGKHKTNYGCYVASKALGYVLSRLYPRKPLPILSQQNDYGATRLRGNLLGEAARTVAIGGGGSSGNSGSGTITGSAPNGLRQAGSVTGTVSLVYAADTITITDDYGPIPRGTWPTVSVTLSGATDASQTDVGANVALNTYYLALNPVVPAGTPLVAGGLLYFDNVKGLLGFRGGSNQGVTQIGTNNAGASSSPAAEVIAEAVTGGFYFESNIGAQSADLNATQVQSAIYFAPSTALSGKIHYLIPAMLHRADALA
jgi:hypothetical protein